jgi:hypothetical protein
MKTKIPKKRNQNDSTLINVRASNRKIKALSDQVDVLTVAVKALTERVQDVQNKVYQAGL